MAGKMFEDLPVGATFRHEPSRTVTETDNLLITTLTMNTQPLHLDAEYAKTTEFGRPLVNSMFTLALVVGLSVSDTTLGTTVGNLGFEKVEFPKPVFVGDTITVTTTVLEARRSKSRPEVGIVLFEHVGTNQRGEIVCRAKRYAMMRARTVPA
ncbi:MAG TPA: MaoC family dehydratase [Candidatus Binatia bacterium]